MVNKKPLKSAAGELAEQLRVITSAVPGLRKAGVTELELDGLKLAIEPEPLGPSAAAPGRVDTIPDDFLDPKKFRGRDREETPDDLDLDEGDDR